jgi:2-dehydro-3-deoxy-D-arabinonate dehydratase
MKLYKIKDGVAVEQEGTFYIQLPEQWDAFVNCDDLLTKMTSVVTSSKPTAKGKEIVDATLEAPIQSQELWAAGVTYMRSKIGRQEESTKAGGGDFYARVYEAERPELFFKSTNHRIVGPGKHLRIRRDSSWNVPEPELTLMITSSGKIVGYTVGNDVSSRSIEGENPLYLPQAKTYDACVSIGPCIYVPDKPLAGETTISLEIIRSQTKVFEGSVEIAQMKRTPEELVSFLYRECTFPHGSLLMTGTGIVPSNDFTLRSGDRVRISIESIGILENTIA